MTKFEALLSAARETVRAAQPADVDGAGLDQILAAHSEAQSVLAKVGDLLTVVAPDREWARARSSDSDQEIAARVIVAMSFASRICPHLRAGGPQPAYVKLALHRVDCARCGGTVRRPPPDEDDRCDWCGERDVELFQPIVLQNGPFVIMGDACEPCGSALLAGIEAP